MYCNKCGKEITGDSEFCGYCGTTVRAAQPYPPGPPAAPPPPPAMGTAPAFFSSPAGIVVIVLIALCVIAAVVVPVVLLTKNGKSNAGFEQDLEAAWGKFQDCAARMDTQLENVAGLNTIYADSLKSFVSENKGSMAVVEKALVALTPPDKYESSYQHLLQATKDYESYLGKLESFITAHAANTSDPRLDGLLTDMTNLASSVKTHVQGFLRDNDVIEASGFDPAILALPLKYADQLATIREVKAQEEADQLAELEKATLAYVKANSDPSLEFKIISVAINGNKAVGVVTCTNQNLERPLVIMEKGSSGWYGVNLGTGFDPPAWYEEEMQDVETAMLDYVGTKATPGQTFEITSLLFWSNQAAGIAVCTNRNVDSLLVIMKKGSSGWYGVNQGTDVTRPDWYWPDL